MQRKTMHYGAVYFSITLFIGQLFVYLDENLLYLSYYSLLILAFGDGASGLFGATLKYNFKLTKYKTLVGFISFVLCSLLSLLVVDQYLLNIGLSNILILVITSAVVELLTDSGLDNFSIYFISLFILKLLLL
jgi:dolichol kinase